MNNILNKSITDKRPNSSSELPMTTGLKAVVILAAGTFAVGTDAYIIAGFLPKMGRSLGVAQAAAGQSLTVFTACYALSSPELTS